MHVQRYTDPTIFLEHVTPHIIQHEAENNLIFGVTASIIAGRYESAYMSVLEADSNIIQVMLRTPPFPIQVSHMNGTPSPEQVEAVITEWDDVFGAELTGMGGPKDAVGAYAAAWQARHGVNAVKAMQMRIYRLTEVKPVVGVPGQLRRITADDAELVAQWIARFSEDTGTGDGDIDTARETVDYALKADPAVRALYLWEVGGKPVSMAGNAGPTPHGIRVNAVYTPPEQRKKGYASACVAALTQKLLDEGRDFTFLFTDLTNPTSNHIYQEIGYEPVTDNDMWRFSGDAG